MQTPRKYFLVLLVIIPALLAAAPIRVLYRADLRQDKLRTLDQGPGTYFSTIDLARILDCRYYFNPDQHKIVLYLASRVKISGGSSYIIVGDQAVQMPLPTKIVGDDIYIPAEAFFGIINHYVVPGISYNTGRQLLDIDVVNFNINSLTVEEKSNGTIIRLQTKTRFPDGNISSFVNSGWFYITIAEGIADSLALIRSDYGRTVRRVEIDQLEEAVQVALQLRPKIESHDVYQTRDPSEIVISLRTPVVDNLARLKDIRDRWHLDTVVLDAGHGGKDGGTVGRTGTKEKDVVLDIVKRVGLLLEKNTNIKVVYTRDEDVFIPLLDRPKIANANNGKVFVSVHANSAPSNRKVSGFETYLLGPSKTQDAIEVAAKENEVIKLEEAEHKYSDMNGEALIMATMAQSSFMKESETLAAVIQTELDKRLSSPNRGVKQNVFYVLIGASMPSVLVETGFLSNSQEEKNLKKPAYRQKIAEGIYRAIVEFKNSREMVLAEG